MLCFMYVFNIFIENLIKKIKPSKNYTYKLKFFKPTRLMYAFPKKPAIGKLVLLKGYVIQSATKYINCFIFF